MLSFCVWAFYNIKPVKLLKQWTQRLPSHQIWRFRWLMVCLKEKQKSVKWKVPGEVSLVFTVTCYLESLSGWSGWSWALQNRLHRSKLRPALEINPVRSGCRTLKAPPRVSSSPLRLHRRRGPQAWSGWSDCGWTSRWAPSLRCWGWSRGSS